MGSIRKNGKTPRCMNYSTNMENWGGSWWRLTRRKGRPFSNAQEMTDLLEKIAETIICIDHPYPTCVAIDGIDAAGKTTLADRLAARLRERGRSLSVLQ
ncbi:MAG: hypothetical protein F9K27_13610 [Anaerolineae bacterium]|nr:MAG: hypothetical protein F9K27_13610 [Anaerolineae bacterium]